MTERLIVMAKFKHITNNDWEWISSLASSISSTQNEMFKPFTNVQISGDQFLRIASELRDIQELIDQADINQIAAAVATPKD